MGHAEVNKVVPIHFNVIGLTGCGWFGFRCARFDVDLVQSAEVVRCHSKEHGEGHKQHQHGGSERMGDTAPLRAVVSANGRVDSVAQTVGQARVVYAFWPYRLKAAARHSAAHGPLQGKKAQRDDANPSVSKV